MGDITREPAKLTVPPAVRFEFEKFALEICDKAEVDYADRLLRIQEWTQRLQALWREAAEKLDTDAATETALGRFGVAEEIARRYRGGLPELCHRFLYYERYRLRRQVLPAAALLLHHWLRMSGSVHWTITASPGYRLSFVTADWVYYIGILLLAVTVIPRWAPRVLPIPRKVFEIMAAALALWLFGVILYEWWDTWRTIAHEWTSGGWHRPGVEDTPMWKDAVFGVFWVVALLVEAVALIAVAPLVFAEIFDLSTRRRQALEEAKRQRG